MGDLGLGLCLGNSTTAGGGGASRHKPQWIDLLGTSVAETTEPLMKGIDVNRVPTVEKETEEEEVGVSSPNSTVSSVSGKRGQREGSENDRTFSNGVLGTSDDEDTGYGSRKKLRLSKDQSAVLEESFKEHNTLTPKQKLALAKQLKLRPRQVEVWFQNRRARTKLKQTELDCEFLKRCCENLTDENRRLQKEVRELRSLKLSPQFYMQMTPPTTLTMCPSCEGVAVSSNASGATTAACRPCGTAAAPDQKVSRHHHRISSANATSGVNRQYQQQPFFQHREVGGRPALLWAPTPFRTVQFLDTPAAQRS